MYTNPTGELLWKTHSYSQSLQHFLLTCATERTHFTSRLSSGRLGASIKPELVSSLMGSSAQMDRTIFEEGHSICKRVALDTWSMEPPQFCAVPEEKLLHFRRG